MRIKKGNSYELTDGRTATITKNYIKKQQITAEIDGESVVFARKEFQGLIVKSDTNTVKTPAGGGPPPASAQVFRLRNGELATVTSTQTRLPNGQDGISYHTEKGREHTVTKEYFDDLIKNRNITLL